MLRTSRSQIGSLTLPNPLIAASGCFGYGLEYAQVVDLSTLGGVVVEGTLPRRSARAIPRRASSRPRPGMLNAIGLQGIGVHRFVKEKLPRLRELRRRAPFVNVCGTHARRVRRGRARCCRDTRAWPPSS